MEIQSKQLSNQRVASETVITFPHGIPGFEDQTHFKLFQQEDSEIVYSLQSVDNENLSFSVAHPAQFNINYNFVLTDEEEQLLQLDDQDDLVILLILHKDDTSSRPTVKGSIKAPLLINCVKRIGIQKWLTEFEQSVTLTEKASEIDVSET